MTTSTIRTLKPPLQIPRSDAAQILWAARRMQRKCQRHNDNPPACFAEGVMFVLRRLNQDSPVTIETQVYPATHTARNVLMLSVECEGAKLSRQFRNWANYANARSHSDRPARDYLKGEEAAYRKAALRVDELIRTCRGICTVMNIQDRGRG